MNNFSENNFNKILDKLSIQSNDKVLVNSNILNLIARFKDQNLPNKIINCLKNRISPGGTLLFPTYNWDFCKGKDFNFLKTKSNTGALSNLTLKMKDFKRTRNPIYSFSVYGKDKEKIATMKHFSCFGLNSPFGYLIKNQGKNLFIDLDYKEAFTFVHVAEEKIGVDYRYMKQFKGNYIDKNKNKKIQSFQMYVRKTKEVSKTVINKKFDNKLKKRGIFQQISFQKIKFSMIKIMPAYELMISDIKNKKGLIIGKKI